MLEESFCLSWLVVSHSRLFENEASDNASAKEHTNWKSLPCRYMKWTPSKAGPRVSGAVDLRGLQN